ncbi:MAG TPA: SDR family oxidoreductase [Pirellulales bacterium]|jgi:NAD(P)-dependent dehydrogenase (short-subunit alcohol dehydrogenase family)
MANPFLEELFSLAGQVAVVTGGTGVLGGALCQGLAQAGATIVVAGRNRERGEERVRLIHEAGGKASFLPVEVSERSSVEALLDAALSQQGRVDMLINGAGVNSASSYADVRDEDWNFVLANNLTAVHLGCQIFGGHMTATGGGAILNIASVTADRPLSKVFAYSASKAAVVNLTRNVAREFAPHGVRVNALCPGFFPAEQNRKILDAERTTSIMQQTPMARFGKPEELVGTALLLLSRTAGSFITGAAYYVDGGFTAMRF